MLVIAGRYEYLKLTTIAYRECVAIVLLLCVFSQRLSGKQVIMNIDNTLVYYSVNAGKSKDPKLMKFIRAIYFYTSIYHITYRCGHLSSEANAIADSLSRLDIPRFRLLYLEGDYLMTQLRKCLY